MYIYIIIYTKIINLFIVNGKMQTMILENPNKYRRIVNLFIIKMDFTPWTIKLLIIKRIDIYEQSI
ncbi:conserved hypothetical protein [Candidatus Nitrosotenuis uzonensis]|uniref:Uncharacterized protein n=1 Tax=Candidatus Nitrosotenuis uzonensis TaxID=1407055 RepID=A0A812F3M2_9ARCH|nr:conserved hypothetical protein [Candidatus Nitrosotenuis uzonensis]